MAELPEIAKLSKQMNDTLKGKRIANLILMQEKCSNISADEFRERIIGAKIDNIYYKGKWIITALSNQENILLSLGMGADILFFENETSEAEKYQIKLLFSDGSGYTARFWWFGKFHLVSDNELVLDSNIRNIAIDPFDERFTYDYFSAKLAGKKTQIKAFLMDQKNVGGVGNMYMHDILFKAGLHPQKKISEMSQSDMKRIYDSMIDVLNLSSKKGTFAFENDFFGEKGGYTINDFLIGYKENQPCPICSEKIISIKTGSTSTFICSNCQKI